MNTESTARTSTPYMPVPTPPGVTSDIMMFTNGTAPPKAVYESCAEFTAPVDVPVVDAANTAEPGIPNRTSLPSMFGPDATGATSGFDCDSKCQAIRAEVTHRRAITMAST